MENVELSPNQATIAFIADNKTADVRQLALKARPGDVDMPYALEQIAGWQTARHKLPSWAAVDGIVFPPHLSMEQCSSEPTAVYKQRLAERLAGDNAERHVDLTGGFGVDFSYMSRRFLYKTYVERQQRLCDTARSNMPLLSLADAEIVCGDAADYLRSMPHATTIFIDPARRDGNGARTFAISDCTPDVMALRDELLQHADSVIVKLSPMLDWHKAADDLECVSEVHIVSVRNECKELLLVLNASTLAGNQGAQEPRLFCVDCQPQADGGWRYVEEEFSLAANSVADVSPAMPPYANPEAGMWLYEPNASLMKAGCFNDLSCRYSMPQISSNSHLFLSADFCPSFPGRIFRINAVSDMNKKTLRRTLAGISKANIATRNFHISVADLRKRLKLQDGGSAYIFATTLNDGKGVLLITEKAPAR